MVPRPRPLTARDLWVRIALYVVSVALWLLLALFSNNGWARVSGAFAGLLNVLLLASSVRRYRALRRGEAGK